MHLRSASLYSSFLEIKLFWLCDDLDACMRWHCSRIASCSPSNKLVQVNASSSLSPLFWSVVGVSIERKSADRLSKMLWKFCSPCARTVVLSLLKWINACFTFVNNAACEDIFTASDSFYFIASKKTLIKFPPNKNQLSQWKIRPACFANRKTLPYRQFYILNRFAPLKMHWLFEIVRMKCQNRR